MKFQYKIQQYQTDAVEAVVSVFSGQGAQGKQKYIRDIGKVEAPPAQTTLSGYDEYDPYDDTAYKNADVTLDESALLRNIQNIQKENNIKISSSLVKDLGACSLEMPVEVVEPRRLLVGAERDIAPAGHHFGEVLVLPVRSAPVRTGDDAQDATAS